MGSSGSGSFGNYGDPEKDRCGEAVDFRLDEVGLCEYFKKHGAVPAKSVAVRLRTALVGRRLAVEVGATSDVVGLVPTDFNYLVACLGKRFSYQGSVTTSRNKPIPTVEVHLEPVAH